MTAIVFKLASLLAPKEKDLPNIFDVSRYPMGPFVFTSPGPKDFKNKAAKLSNLLPDQVETYSGREKSQTPTGGSSGPKWSC